MTGLNSPFGRNDRHVFQYIADSRWTEANPDPNATYPRLGLQDTETANNAKPSTYWLRDGSYLRFKQLSLGYTFKQGVVEKLGLTKLRYYLTADNVYLWSKRKGLDPRTSLAGDNDDAVYSPIRTVSMGLTLNF